VNRHERRGAVRSVRRYDLITHLVPSCVSLAGHATLHNAVLHWRTNLDVRKPVCIGCKASFLRDDARVGAFLLSVPVGGRDIVATSAFCTSCHETLSMNDIERAATRVLRSIVPGGKFLDPP
jgi:hypothetical protein